MPCPRAATVALPTCTRSAKAALEERRQQVEAARGAVEAAKDKLAGVADRLGDVVRERTKLQAKLEK